MRTHLPLATKDKELQQAAGEVGGSLLEINDGRE